MKDDEADRTIRAPVSEDAGRVTVLEFWSDPVSGKLAMGGGPLPDQPGQRAVQLRRIETCVRDAAEEAFMQAADARANAARTTREEEVTT